MRWRSAIAEGPSVEAALRTCADRVAGKTPPDVAFLFPSARRRRDFERLGEDARKMLKPQTLLGCSGGGVIGAGVEVEHPPAVGLLCGWLPQARIRPYRLEQESMPGPDAPPGAWRKWMRLDPAREAPSFVVLSDPFSIDAEAMVQGLDFAFPDSVKVGGVASGAAKPGGNTLFLDGKTYRTGAVGAAFDGNVVIDPIVAQGCRPIGGPMQVTRCRRNLLMELDGTPVLRSLEALFEGLDDDDQRLARSSLFLGIRSDPVKQEASGWLVRNLIGLDPQRGILAVGSFLRPGQSVQFLLRDRRASEQDLAEHLDRYEGADRLTAPAGALLFSCLGRGRRLYGEPNHDTAMFRDKVAPVPIAGFFCNGEFGPVEGSTYLHGFTSCFGVFRPRHGVRRPSRRTPSGDPPAGPGG